MEKVSLHLVYADSMFKVGFLLITFLQIAHGIHHVYFYAAWSEFERPFFNSVSLFAVVELNLL